MEKRKKSSFVEINPSGFPKMRKKRNLRRGGHRGGKWLGKGNGPQHRPIKKSNFFSNFFCLEMFTLRTFLVLFVLNRAAFDSGSLSISHILLEASQDCSPHKKEGGAQIL